tara:strand:+ start:341 stop:529 length:189 start_codon:yes stop_codon:yes gene_type:complete
MEENQGEILLAWRASFRSKEGERMRSLRLQEQPALESMFTEAKSDPGETKGFLEGYHILKPK